MKKYLISGLLTLGLLGTATGVVQAKEIATLSSKTTLSAFDKQKNIPERWNQRERKVVYLTFDDGPSRNTENIVNILEDYGITGTFFFVGTQVEKRPDLVELVADAGNYVGMHSISHSVETLYNDNEPNNLTNELIQMQDMIEEITGERPILFRAPYGSMPYLKNSPITDVLVENGFKEWDWTVDTYDWKVKSVSDLMAMVEASSGSKEEIVLMHEKDLTIEALPTVIEYYLEKGYEFRSYDELNHVICNHAKDERL